MPPGLGGLAAAAAITGLLALGLAGGMFASSAELVTSAAGFLFGVAALSVFVAPGLRRLGSYTAADFFGARFGSAARLTGAAVAFSSSFLILLAHLKTSGPLLADFLGITPAHGLYAAAGLTILVLLP